MANHVRKQIRAAATTALTNLTTTGTRVHGYRAGRPLKESELPALCVYTPADQASYETVHAPALVERELDLRVLGFAVGAEGTVDDTIDTIAKEVETALAAGLTISSKTYPVIYQGCDITFELGEKKTGEIEMKFLVRIFNAANTPDAFS